MAYRAGGARVHGGLPQPGHNPWNVDLCAHLHVSERTLRYVFNEQMGCPPATYLRRLRLNGARAELLAPGAATTSVTACDPLGLPANGAFFPGLSRAFSRKALTHPGARAQRLNALSA
ncbi:helix-turn-helix domain-containing protein [Thiorhodovibrio frisius]|uniref:helix-turn-helix domain-containing protein n=1 Tax=Thiorhodovibrio frisius TaxID=631362 RepID=UPI0009FE1B35|nr:helix-turn-helix domain-containing protein [Thiorhodovibrio frisius]